MEHAKTCGNCRHDTICKLSASLWNCYRETIQCRINDSSTWMAEVQQCLASRCVHWHEYPTEGETMSVP